MSDCLYITMEIVMFTVDIIALCTIGDLSMSDVIQAMLLP